MDQPLTRAEYTIGIHALQHGYERADHAAAVWRTAALALLCEGEKATLQTVAHKYAATGEPVPAAVVMQALYVWAAPEYLLKCLRRAGFVEQHGRNGRETWQPTALGLAALAALQAMETI